MTGYGPGEPLPPGAKVRRLICVGCVEAWIIARRTADETGRPLNPPTCSDEHAIGWVQPYDIEFCRGRFPVKWESSGGVTLESAADVGPLLAAEGRGLQPGAA
jgi:hypothetical protein